MGSDSIREERCLPKMMRLVMESDPIQAAFKPADTTDSKLKGQVQNL